MPPPTILFFETTTARFYGAGRALLWLMQRLQQTRPLFVAASEGPLTARVRAAGIETIILPLPGFWRQAEHRADPLGRWLRRFLAPITSLTLALRLARLARQHGAAGIHANSTRAALLAGPAARLARVPLWWHLRTERRPGPAERLAYAFCDRVLCVSTAVQQALGAPARSVVILDGAPLERMPLMADGAAFRRRLGWPPDALVVGAAASLAPNKRHDLFIALAKRLASDFPHARFVICGDQPVGVANDYAKQLAAMAEPLVSQGRLVFAGFVEDMAAAYAAMDIFVFPSDVEGFGLVAAEAMMMGAAVVRTDAAGASDMIRDGESGFIVPAGDGGALTASVARLLADPDLRQRVARAGQQFARAHLTAERNAAEVEALMVARRRKDSRRQTMGEH